SGYFYLLDKFGVASIISGKETDSAAANIQQLNDSIGLGYANVIASLEGGADGIKGTFSEGTGINFARLTRIMPVIEKKVMARTGIDDTRAATQSGKIQSGRKTAHEIGKGDKTVSLSSFSDIDDVRRSAVLLGYDLSEDDLRKVLDSVQRVCKKKDEVGKREFEAIIASSAMQVPSTYHIDSYFTSSSNISSSVSRVVLMRDGEKIEGFASGDGPVDASFLAIERCVGHHYELDDFQIQAVTEGRESLGSALVKLRSNGNLYSGNGLSTDIVGASIRAYIDALNKIIWMEEKR
ncbi:MAG: hypothetical protein IKS28_01485, partial [Clostridia bacterium]|nr:hypothetical protein [Clostridia bacterium]